MLPQLQLQQGQQELAGLVSNALLRAAGYADKQRYGRGAGEKLSPIRKVSGTADLVDSWTGIGRIGVGMARQGFDLQPTRYDERSVLHDRDGALADELHGHRAGAWEALTRANTGRRVTEMLE